MKKYVFFSTTHLVVSKNQYIVKGLKAGQLVDQFRISRKLGQGGMSDVYLARDTTLGRQVALKIIKAEFADSQHRLQLFLQEARLTAKFSHPHIIAIYFVGQFEEHPYLALEYLEGQTLAQRMQEGAMTARETMRIGLAMAQALEEAHSHGVLHRDLKPANVIIPKDGRLRVLDFGISKAAEDSINPPLPAQDQASALKPEETVFGEIKGTPAYMAPERWLGQKVTSAADLWALGVILFKMLAQVHPFISEERTIDAVARQIVLTQEPPSLPSDADVPPELSRLIISMIDAQPSRRPTAKLVVEVLQELLQRKRDQPLARENPFRGLLPFSERYAGLFFGRSAEIEMAVERLRHEPVLPIVGPSGAGKSSFVAAGIIPRLRELDRWLVLTIRPGTDPFFALSSIIQAGSQGDLGTSTSISNDFLGKVTVTAIKKELSKKVAAVPECTDLEPTEKTTQSAQLKKVTGALKERSFDTRNAHGTSSVDLAQKLLESPATLILELQALADETQSKVLLFVDQLEELYTQDHPPYLRLSFMEAISRGADDPGGPVRVIFTLRDDFLGRVAESPAARETLSHIMVLRSPSENSLYETVTKPVDLAGYAYEDENLPEEMLDAVREAPASLPILQFACSQLWNRRDKERKLLTRLAYSEMGGVEGALASKADELLAGFTEGQRNVVRQLVLRLVTPDGTRRVITPQELLDGLDSSAAHILDRLAAARMVVSRRAVGKDSSETELELVHDSLIHSWAPLVRWLEQSREEVIFLDEVSLAATLWDSRGRPREEVWSGDALDEAKLRIKRCEAVPKRVTEFVEAGELQRQARARRRRKIIIAGFGLLLSVIALLILMNRETVIQRELAVTERNRERQARAAALREGARAAYTKGDFLEARSKLRASLEARDSIQARALWWLLENEPLIWSKSLDLNADCVSVSPNGRLIAVGSRYINIYDTKTFERRVLSGHKRQVMSIDFSPNGRWLSSGAYDKEVRLWDLREDTVNVLKGHSNAVTAIAFSPDGKRVVSGSRDYTIKIWDIESGSPIQNFKFKRRVNSLRYTPDGRFIISGSSDGKVRFINSQTYKIEQIFEELGTAISDAIISRDGRLLAFGSNHGSIVVMDLNTKQIKARISGNYGVIFSLSFNPNSDRLAASTEYGKILVLETQNWSIINEFDNTDIVRDITFLPDGDQLASVGYDGMLRVWQTNIQSLQKDGAGHGSIVCGLAFAPDGNSIATGNGDDGALRFWDLSGQLKRRVHGYGSGICHISFNPIGKLLAAGTKDGRILLYTMPEAKHLKTIHGHGREVSGIIFTPTGKQIISSSDDETIAFWNTERLTLDKEINAVNSLQHINIDPEGRLLASAGMKRIDLIDIDTGQILKIFSGHTKNVFSVIFSPDGKSIYSSNWDYTVRRYQLDNASTSSEVVARHQGNIYFIDILNSRETILGTPSADKTAKLWNLDKGTVVTLKGHHEEVNNLKFSPDGASVATVSDDRTLRLWDVKTGRPLWRAPLMLEEPPLLFTQQGWIRFDGDSAPLTSTKQWQKAVEARGKLASTTVDQETLCLVSFDDELEIWDLTGDERIFKKQQTGILEVVAIHQGCLTRSDEKLTLTKGSGNVVTLAQQVEAMRRFKNSVFVLQGGKVRILDLDGNSRDEFTVTRGASALAVIGDTIALGFSDGRIEVWRRDAARSERVFSCREVEFSPVTTIIPGPPGAIIAGFANGTVGIWSLETGERLFAQRLHGPVIHLLHRDQSLFAASELGSTLQLDLSTFYTEYCELMERVWSSVPWIWEEGRPRFRERPADHVCAAGR